MQQIKEEVKIPKYFIVVIPLLFTLIGVGISFGIVKNTVSTNSKRLDTIEKKMELLIEIRTDINWIKQNLKQNGGSQ